MDNDDDSGSLLSFDCGGSNASFLGEPLCDPFSSRSVSLDGLPSIFDEPDGGSMDQDLSGGRTDDGPDLGFPEIFAGGADEPPEVDGQREHPSFEDIGDVVDCPPSGSFRLQGNIFHLTYRDHIQPEPLLDVVGGGVSLRYWSIVWELGSHDAGQPYAHTHFFFRSAAKLSKRSARCFDVNGIHPHIQRVSNTVHEGRIYHLYHRKAPIQLWQSKEAPPDPGLRVDRDRLIATIKQGTLFDSANALGIEIKSISDLKAIREERERTPASYSEYDASDFILSFDWFTSFGGRRVSVDAVFLYGGSGLGKTEFAVSRFGQYRSDGSRELGCLLVRRLDQAKDYSPVHYSGVVFDDVDLSNCSAEEKIHMLDSNYPAIIKCRYQDGVLPPRTKRIFTSNRDPETFWRTNGKGFMCDEQWNAIRRRCKFIHILGPTFNVNS